MKTITLIGVILLSTTLTSADVLTVDKFTIVKDKDGSMSIRFDLSAIPAHAHVDLAVLSVNAGALTITEPVQFVLRDASGQKIGYGGLGKTRPDIAGKQKARFLLTAPLQAWVKGETKRPKMNLGTRNRTGCFELDASFVKKNTQLVVYYTVPG